MSYFDLISIVGGFVGAIVSSCSYLVA